MPIGWEDDMIKKNTRFFSTGLFITHLWYSFDLSQYRKNNQRHRELKRRKLTPQLQIANATDATIAYSPHPFAHLCAVLQPAYLEAFDLDSVRIRSAFCSAANVTTLPPAPTTSGTRSITSDILAGYSDTISTLFAYLLISSSRNSVEADQICVKAKERQADVDNSG
jgi:hypothetical protein